MPAITLFLFAKFGAEKARQLPENIWSFSAFADHGRMPRQRL